MTSASADFMGGANLGGFLGVPGAAAAGAADYTYSPNSTGGVNYFSNGTPITNTQYRQFTGGDTNAIEAGIAQQYAQRPPQNDPNLTNNNTNTYARSTGYGGTAYDPAALQNAYNASFDTQTQGLQNQQALAQQIANSGQSRVDNSFNVQRGGLDQQYGAGNANLDLSQNKLNTSHANSLRDLGQQMRLANQSYSNQLGVAGAGDSSASGVLNYALSQQANQQHNDIMNNVDQQQTGLNLQRSQLSAGYDQNKKMLDDWHASQVQNIVNQYATQMGQLQQALDNAQGQKAIDLAYIGKGQASSQAISQMQALQAQYQQHLGDLSGAYNNIQAPTAQLGDNLTQQYNVNPIDAGTIAQQNFAGNQTTSPGSDYSANVALKKSNTDNPYQYNI